MPKMTRRGFRDLVEFLWERAQDNVYRSGHLVPALVAYDQMGRETLLAGVPADADEAKVREMTESGVVPVPFPWSEGLDQIRAVFQERKIVAAVMLAEAWSVAGEQRIADIIELGSNATDFPLHDEVVVVTGMWPRENIAAQVIAQVIRHQDRPPTLEPWAEDVLNAPDKPMPMLGSWLTDVLPGPY